MALTVGQMTPSIRGDITQLNALILGTPARTAENLGYHANRLDAGYYVLVLKRLPTPAEFRFSGNTMRSGGKYGLPGSTDAADAARPTVHDDITAERGSAGYEALQQQVLQHMRISGAKRLVKVIPLTAHDPNMPPDKQYPMGGGFLQWTLKAPGLPFLCAAQIGPGGSAILPRETLAMDTGNVSADYAARAKLQQHLQTA